MLRNYIGINTCAIDIFSAPQWWDSPISDLTERRQESVHCTGISIPAFDSISSAQIVAENACFKIATEKGRNRGVFEEGHLAGTMLVQGFLKRSFGLYKMGNGSTMGPIHHGNA
ncbi:hypothetical protein BVK86_23805 [Pseudomonas reinekei]|uniref:Uncharacterized protein n=1 Tax=Pseudomonas reinekei TaxID=395598 RepID=A0A1Q9WMK1_PSERE|nr:hypothetical protein BVK86_23805 [Pseudomonas reinekei]